MAAIVTTLGLEIEALCRVEVLRDLDTQERADLALMSSALAAIAAREFHQQYAGDIKAIRALARQLAERPHDQA